MSVPDDLTKLPSLDPDAIEAALKSRYASDKIYSNINTLLVALNPYKAIPGIYSGDTLRAYTQYAAVPEAPHVYAIAGNAYRGLLESNSQSIVISGESGAGKTETSKIILQFLAHAATASSSSSSIAGLEGRIIASTPVLEAFGNARTLINDNSSRYGKFLMLQFDHSGKIEGASMSTYLLEKSRVASQIEGERNYHSFYQLCASPLAAGYGIVASDAYTLLGKGNAMPTDSAMFLETDAALEAVGFTVGERKASWKLLAAALLLGNLTFGPEIHSGDEESVVVQPDVLSQISKLLQVDEAELTFSLTKRKIRAGREFIASPCNIEQSGYVVEGVVKALYSKLFDWAVGRVNASLSVGKEGKEGTRSAFFIGILDIFGFEHFEFNSLEQLCINFTNEKLQNRFNESVFASAAEENATEGVQVDDADMGDFDNQEVLVLVEGYPTGLFAMINEECVVPQGSDATLHEKMVKQHMSSRRFKKVIKQKDRFAVVHYAGTVAYSSSGMLGKNKDTVPEDMLVLMQSSEDGFVRTVFASTVVAAKRGGKFQGMVAKFGKQLTELMHLLDSSDMHFIRCVKPNTTKAAGAWDTDTVMRQLRCSGVLEAVRVFGMGYPDRVQHSEVVSRFGCIPPLEQQAKDGLDDKAACEMTLNALLQPNDFALGRTKAFLKSGVLARLRLQRVQLVASKASFIQARMRGMMNRKIWHEAGQSLLDRKATEAAEKRRADELVDCLREEEAAKKARELVLSKMDKKSAEKARKLFETEQATLKQEELDAAIEAGRRKTEEEAYLHAFELESGVAKHKRHTKEGATVDLDEFQAAIRLGKMPHFSDLPEFRKMPKDVLEYAAYLGMDPTIDKDLLWIAEEALKAPDPPGWEECLDQRGLLYFVNETTGQTSRHHPMAEYYQALYFKMKTKKGETVIKQGASRRGSKVTPPAQVMASFKRQNTFDIELGPTYTSMAKALQCTTPRSTKLVAAKFGNLQPRTDVRSLLVNPARLGAMSESILSKDNSGVFAKIALHLALAEDYRAFGFHATKHSNSKHTEVVLSLDEADGASSNGEAGRMRTNLKAQEWIMYDDNADAYGIKTGKPRVELGLILFRKRMVGPIEAELIIPRVDAKGVAKVYAPTTPAEAMIEQYKAGRTLDLHVLSGFIIVQPGAGAVELTCQDKSIKGKVLFKAVKHVDGTWSMSYTHPLSALQAFNFLLSLIHNPVTCALDVAPKTDFGSSFLDGRKMAPDLAARNGALPQIVNTKDLKCLSDAVFSLAVVDNVVFAGGQSGTIRVWHMDHYINLAQGAKPELDTLVGHWAAVNTLIATSEILVSGSEDKTIVVWDLATLKPRGTLLGHTWGVTTLALFGSTLVSGGDDKSLRVWDVKTLASVKIVEVAHALWIRCIAVHKSGTCATGSADKSVRIWKTKDWSLVGSLNASSDVYALAIGADKVYAACSDCRIRVWLLGTLQKSHIFMGHTGTVRSLFLDESTSTLYSAAEDKRVKVWDLKSGQCATLFGHSRFLRAVTYNSTTKALYSGGDDATVKMWEAVPAMGK
mmetsp:Transcript_26989/g.66543  ORF Transcript_26989/g.66543 Transcript_26989/m.66543 type:complete len:1539 (+) Transcript_26989:64-4680(+)